jgi:phosphoglycolate phosphatase
VAGNDAGAVDRRRDLLVSTTGGIQLACLDMAGTTVGDGGAVEQAFLSALDALEVPDARRPAMLAYVRETMGTSKIEVFRALFGDEQSASDANRAFESAYETGIDAVRPIPGAAETIERLRASGLRVALTTGFSAHTRDLLLESLGWTSIADLVLSPSDAGRGRPFPDMVLTAVLRLRIDSVQAVAVVGDTVADITAGVRAGASVVAGVLTGTDDRSMLLHAGATHVFESVATLASIVGAPADDEGAPSSRATTVS